MHRPVLDLHLDQSALNGGQGAVLDSTGVVTSNETVSELVPSKC